MFAYVKLISFFFLCSLSSNTLCQLYTQPATYGNVDSMVQILFASPNVQILNVSFVGDYSLPNQSSSQIRDIGYFNSINSTVGIDSGLILTGGFLDPPFGLSQPDFNTANYWKMTSGDSMLDSIIQPSITTSAAILEFDFISNGDSIKFSYVFASDEYPYQICHSDNDVFAFHISGPGINGLRNIALVPNTLFPVGNNTIN